ncbi:MAG: hypothetical protein LCH39_03745 [Proteobacteria bacterium]|nr:hypothetical protein [Pseudomonadota bacterium]
MGTIIAIFRQSWLTKLGILGLIIGAGMIGYSVLSGPPSRESLQTVEGTITGASRVARTSKRTRATTSYYEMTLKPADGSAELKLRVPSIEMAETDVRSIITRTVKAEFDSEQDVYVLSSGNREVLTYKNSLERRNLNFRQHYVDGIAAMIGSALALLIGLFLGFRKLRKDAAAAKASGQG